MLATIYTHMNNVFICLLLAFKLWSAHSFLFISCELAYSLEQSLISRICQHLPALSLLHILCCLIAVWPFLFQSSFVFIVWFSEVLGSSMGVLGFTSKFHVVSIKAALLINSPKSENPVSLQWRMGIHNVVYTNSEILFIRRSIQVL